MPRLRSAEGVVVNVSDEKAARLGSRFAAVEEPAPAKKTTAKKAASSKSEK